MDKQTQDRIVRFQDSLPELRKVAGWSAEELGAALDVTRQTVLNLETGQTKMTMIQYWAFRGVLEQRARDSKNETLVKLIALLVDTDALKKADRDKIKLTINEAANRVGRRAGAAAAGAAATAALLPVVGAVAAGVLAMLGTAILTLQSDDQ